MSRPLRRPRAGPRLRAATGADSSNVVALIRRVLREFRLPFDPDGIDRPLFEIGTHFRGPGRRLWVLEDRDRVVGTVAIDRWRGDVAEIKKMFLDRRYRGRGLGWRMLKRALAYTRRAGYGAVRLETHSTLKASIGMYMKAGFRLRRAIWVPPRCDREYWLDLRRDEGRIAKAPRREKRA